MGNSACQQARQFCISVQLEKQSTINVLVSPREREEVHHIAID
jgi:hypothetical protein